MPRPVVNPDRDTYVLVDVERGSKALRKYIRDIVIGVGAIVEIRAERRLPFLGLYRTVGIGA